MKNRSRECNVSTKGIGYFEGANNNNFNSYNLLNTLLLLLLSCFSHVRLCATPETAAHQAPQSLGFSRQEHWCGFPSPIEHLDTVVIALCYFMEVNDLILDDLLIIIL